MFESTIQVADLLSIGIIGVIAKFIVDWVKAKFGTEGWGTRAVLILLSLIVATIWVLFKDTNFFVVVVQILTVASTVWAFFGAQKK